MAKVVVLGAGVSGHTASMILKRKLGKSHDVIVISPNSNYQWIPSNIWIGVGRMKKEQVVFPLAAVYEKHHINFKQAKAISIHPEGNSKHSKAFVSIEYTGSARAGQKEEVEYDFLINGTGPKLNFEATPGLGPEGYTNSVCTYSHAEESWTNLLSTMDKLSKGQRQKIVIGTGHPMATCQGAAFEYILNVAYEIRRRGLENKAEITWLSNEFEMGDFGMGGAFIKRGGYITSTKVFAESILREYGINWIKRAGVNKIEEGKIHYETLEGKQLTEAFDFSMLIPGFSGVGMAAYDKNDQDITSKLFLPNKFMKVDADYSTKSFESWNINDWPSTYQNRDYRNIFAIGIAFAPPHPMSKPMQSPNGTNIFPAPPRTGMPSGVMGKVVAQNVAKSILTGKECLDHKASMGKMGAACVVSAGFGFRKGMAATMTVFPIVPDYDTYPEYGRSLKYTVGEAGLSGHWSKIFMHHMFLYKAKAKPFWWVIPE